MELRVLRYFIAIVQAKNISKAASRLHVSQPALSRQIHQLEAELGKTLFVRGHRQIHLTSAGYYLYQRATEIINLVDKTEYKLSQKEVISGTLNLGAGESIALQPIMNVLQAIHQAHPDVRINLLSGNTFLIQRKLDLGLLDFGIVMGEQAESIENYNLYPLQAKNQWGMLLPANHPLARKKAIRPVDLLKQDLILPQRVKEMNSFRVWAGKYQTHYHTIGTYNLSYNAALLVKTGACLSLCYEGLANLHRIGGLAFRPLAPALYDSNFLIWSKNTHLSALSQLFLNLVKKTDC